MKRFSDPSESPGWHPDHGDPSGVAVALVAEDAPWRSDMAQDYALDRPRVNAEGETPGLVSVPPRDGGPTLRVAYLFSGRHRKASIAEELKLLCKNSGFGLHFEEVDIMVGGGEHDLLDSDTAAKIEARISERGFRLDHLVPAMRLVVQGQLRRRRRTQTLPQQEVPVGFP